MTTKKLEPTDFMMMDIHRPLTNAEIEEINPQALVDKSAGAEQDSNRNEACVGAPHEDEQSERRYNGPFVVYPENVEVLDVQTCRELDVDRVLQSAYDNNLSKVLVVGMRDDGQLFALCSDPDVAEANLLCDRAKKSFLDAIDSGETREDPRGPKQA